MKLILFDIDGTLLYSTSKVFRERFVYAVEKVTGKKTHLVWEEVEGAIDNSLFAHAWENAGMPVDTLPKHLPTLHEEAYLHFYEHATEEYSETKLNGSEYLLQRLQTNVHLGILTGNYEKVGWRKLELVGLSTYFDFGLFGHEAQDRNELATLVFKKAHQHFKTAFTPNDIILVGDTPRDIACARAIKAKIISVATGKYSNKELAEFHPDLLVDSLSDPAVEKFILGKDKQTT